MSKFDGGHPDEAALLRFLDGETPAGEARRVERHLKACWQCRAAADALETAVAECVEYRKSVLAKYLPEPPQPWAELGEGFARIDAEQPESVFTRMTRPWFGRLNWQLAATALAAAALVVGLFFELRKTPSVEAAALLNRAVGIAESRPTKTSRIRIRTRNHQITRSGASIVEAAAASDERAVRDLFVRARYDWDDPLSARAYRAWRNSVRSKHDEVTTVPDPERPEEKQYLIHTAVEGGELASASLTLRATDLHPVQSRLEFRDQEWVELTEIPEPSMSVTEIEKHLEVPLRPAEPSLPAAPSEATASISDELQVMAALHEIGADLGDPVAISRSEGRVLVSGVGVAPERQRAIRAALDAMPRVTVQFSEPGAVAPGGQDDTGRAPAPGTAAGGVTARLEQQAGGRVELEKISGQILDWSEAAMSRAYALRGLAQRFPAGAEASLTAHDRQVLAAMGREHSGALLNHVKSIREGVGPMLAAVARPGEVHPVRLAANWQAQVEEVFQTSRRVEVLLTAVLGASSGGATADQAGQLLAALGQLEAQVENCRRLVQVSAP